MKSKILSLSKSLRCGDVTPIELTKKYLKDIEDKNPSLNAYVCVTEDTAMRQAKEAEQRIAKGETNPLLGIPFALKDNICTDGIETTCCSNILKGFKPYYDATVYCKLKKSGAILLGKTNMDEFAMGSTSETSAYGAPKNPRNTSFVTGGSSGGAAAATVANLCAYAIGSDTGGSVRQPAAYCGAVGFKPSYGAVSRYGLIAYASSLDQIGPLCSSVTDAKIVYNAIKGKDINDLTSKDFKKGKCFEGLRGVKIGLAREFFDGLSQEISEPILTAAKCLEHKGAKLCDVSLPALEKALPAYYVIACAEASSNLGRYDGIRYGMRAGEYKDVQDMVIKTRTYGFGKEVKKRIMLGTYVLSGGYYDAYYKKATHIRQSVKDAFDEAFKKCDVLLAPVSPTTAPPLGYAEKNKTDTYLADLYTVPVNIAGLPSLSVPCSKDKIGLPIGVQIIGPHGQDDFVLSLGEYMQEGGLCDVFEEER